MAKKAAAKKSPAASAKKAGLKKPATGQGARKAAQKKTAARKASTKAASGNGKKNLKAAAKKKISAGKKTPAKKKVAATKPNIKATKKVAGKIAGKAARKKAGARSSKQEAVDYESKANKLDLNFIGSRDEAAESRNVSSRARVRSELESEVEKFLKSGGKINNIEPNVMADPPKKPESNYGSRPI